MRPSSQFTCCRKRTGGISTSALLAMLVCLMVGMSQLLSPSPLAADPMKVHPSDPESFVVSARAKPVIYLTFDDGPAEATMDLLALLADYEIKATFFMTGKSALNFPDTAVRVAVDGHVVANHTYDHAWLTRTNPRPELERAQEAIERITGVQPVCYRPPYGATNDRVRATAAQLGLTEWLWDLDTLDYRRSVTADEMIDTLDQAASFKFFVGDNGTNVLMHDGGNDGARTVDAMRSWLSTNHDRYDFRLIEGCGGQQAAKVYEQVETTVDIVAAQPKLTKFQTETLFRAFVSQGIDLEAWNVWRQGWEQRVLNPSVGA